MKTLAFRRFMQSKNNCHLPGRLGLSERDFASAVEETAKRLLSFLEYAAGPTRQDLRSNRIWGQAFHGEDVQWHTSLRGERDR